jgi:hypothetical protein
MMDFQIEFRGEVDLKGKGKKRTYLVYSARESSIAVGISASVDAFASFRMSDSQASVRPI